MEPTITCICPSCGKAGVHALTEAEQATLAEYAEKGRAMGRLDSLFPGIPGWIRRACLDPLSGGRALCPECQAKAK